MSNLRSGANAPPLTTTPHLYSQVMGKYNRQAAGLGERNQLHELRKQLVLESFTVN